MFPSRPRNRTFAARRDRQRQQQQRASSAAGQGVSTSSSQQRASSPTSSQQSSQWDGKRGIWRSPIKQQEDTSGKYEALKKNIDKNTALEKKQLLDLEKQALQGK